MEVSQLFMKMISLCLRTVDSAGLSCFCTQRKSTDIFPKTDWLTVLPLSSAFDSYLSPCLNSVWSCPELPMLATSSLSFRPRGWGWNHHRPVTPRIRLEAAWCFCQVFTLRTFRCLLNSYSVWVDHSWANDVTAGVMVSWTKEVTISKVVALTDHSRIIALSEYDWSVFSLQCVLLWDTVFLIVFWVYSVHV